MGRFNLKNLQDKKESIQSKRNRSKRQSASVMPQTKASKKPKKRGCGCGRGK